MKDNEIIKALECCYDLDSSAICCQCPLHQTEDCRDAYLGLQAYNLINRQKAEVERLNYENLQMIASIKHLRVEAIKECIETMKPWYRFLCVDEGDWCQQLEAHAYNLVKEMVGDDNE